MKFTSIKSRSIFSEIMKNGRKVVSSTAVLIFKEEFTKEVTSPESCGFFNLGIIASKKSFKKAVSRNFVKRRIRSAFREMDIKIPHGKVVNLVCIVRSKTERVNYAMFLKELTDNIHQINHNKI